MKKEAISKPVEGEIKIAQLGDYQGVCKECGGAVILEQAPCPEGRYGCLVMHYQNRCQRCGLIQ